MSGGALVISSQVAVGTSSGGDTGDIWSGSSFGSDQFSQITLTSTQLSGGQWIAAAVRAQNSGLNAYAGMYFWNYGSPELMLFKRSSGNWAQLGGTYSPGALPAGTQLQIDAVGSTISFLQNGVQRLSVTDSSITGGAPGIMAAGAAAAANWSGGSATSSATYTVGGSVSGLSGTVVLQDNGGDNLSLSANGAFTFATALAGGTAYNVTVKTNPAGESCTVSNSSGTIASANITNVTVSCANVPTYTVGGSVSGLSGTVVLQDNGGDNLSLSANGAFTFATALAGGTAYTVTVKTNPAGESCTVSNSSGTIASANITNVTVSLRERAHLYGGRERVGAVGDGGAARQRRGQPVAVSERGVHLRHGAGRRHRLQRDRENQPGRGKLHRLQQLGHHRLRQHHQRHRQLHRQFHHVERFG